MPDEDSASTNNETKKTVKRPNGKKHGRSEEVTTARDDAWRRTAPKPGKKALHRSPTCDPRRKNAPKAEGRPHKGKKKEDARSLASEDQLQKLVVEIARLKDEIQKRQSVSLQYLLYVC